MPKPAVQRNSAAADALQHLAENGATREADLRALMVAGKDGKHSLAHTGSTLRRLEGLGFVSTKVWLTPKGLEEVRRLGLMPQREGVVA